MLNGNQRITHTWYVWSALAHDFLSDIRPHLLVKAEEVDIALAFYREMKAQDTNFRRHKGNPPNKAALLAARDAQFEQLRILKRREYSREVLEGMMANSEKTPCPDPTVAEGQPRAKQAA